MSTPAGERSQYLTIWKEMSTVPGSTANTGQSVQSWEIFAYAWGSISEATQAGLQLLTPLMHRHDKSASPSGNVEQWLAFHKQVIASSVIKFPFIDGIDETMRISREHRGSRITYEITGPPLDLTSELVVLCNELPAGTA